MGGTIIVTGASRGLGLAICKFLLQAPQSCNVVVVARTLGPLQQLKDQYGSQVEVLAGDVTDFSMARLAVAAALKAYGRLDGLVLNHGILGPMTKLVQTDIEEWQKGFNVNFFSILEFVKQAIPHLRLSRGKIVFTSTGAAVYAHDGTGLYGSSKAAMNYLNTTLGCEEPEITSVAIRPGMVDTDMQVELRTTHASSLGAAGKKYVAAYEEGQLLKPELPGNVMGRLVLRAPIELSGKFLSWNDKELADFQD